MINNSNEKPQLNIVADQLNFQIIKIRINKYLFNNLTGFYKASIYLSYFLSIPVKRGFQRETPFQKHY